MKKLFFLFVCCAAISSSFAQSVYYKGSRIGEIESDGDIYKNGSRVGQIESDGDVYVNGSRVGQVESDGDVYYNGSRVGEGRGIRQEYLAAFFFFFFWNLDSGRAR
ncbi:MAG: hypothetical protein K2X86_12940 [Cytophagaceae bacterium]|nr:hypothetical protein [Cytophagaceae bacterium]